MLKLPRNEALKLIPSSQQTERVDFNKGTVMSRGLLFFKNTKSIRPSRGLKNALTLIRKLSGGWSLNIAANGGID